MRLFRIVDRYIFLEALGLHALGFTCFLAFLLINKIFLEAENILDPNKPGLAIIKVTLLSAPEYVLWSLPIGILMATLMTMGRLAKDNELVALFGNGISLYRLFLPFFLLSSLSVLFAYITQEYLQTKAAAMQQQIYEEFPQILKSESREPDPFMVRLDDGQFISAGYFDKEQGRLTNIVYDEFTMENGKRMAISTVGSVEGDSLIMGANQREPARIFDTPSAEDGLYEYYVTEPTERINLGLDLRQQYTQIKTPQELSQTELKEQSAIKRQRGESPAKDETDFHMRFSSPFASLAFALVAMPLSIRAPRDERMLGLIITVLLGMVYYTIYFVSKLMGYNEVLPPWLAAWMMNIVFAFIALFIFVFSRK